ncbi:MAG: acyl-CoA carboxylase subunit epsilon, partial [Nocardioides sp.]
MSEKDETEPVENKPPLFVVKGDATAEEVAALVAVLQGMAAAATPPAPKPRP